MAIDIHILNASGALDSQLKTIQSAFKAASSKAKELLSLENADVVVMCDSEMVIKELGVGGYTNYINNIIFIYLDVQKSILSSDLEACMNHEFYHTKRHDLAGLPKTLKERCIDEGLACLYEYETTGRIPIYAKQKISPQYFKDFLKHLNREQNLDKWFFGTDNLPKWIGYTAGYTFVNSYSRKMGLDSTQLIYSSSNTIYNQTKVGLMNDL